MAHAIISREHPKWQRAESIAKQRHGKSLADLGWEGDVLHAIERGEDPNRILHHLAATHGTPSTQEHSQ